MIVIGVDVHKQSLTAVAVDEAGRGLAESTASAPCDLLAWAASLPGERSWAVEDCRQLTRALERALLAAGESLVRVPPKLMAPERRAGRARGKSHPIDALAVARTALREPRLDHPRPGERRLRELKLLVDHRDDLIDERRRARQGTARSARVTRCFGLVQREGRRPRLAIAARNRQGTGEVTSRDRACDPRAAAPPTRRGNRRQRAIGTPSTRPARSRRARHDI